MDTFFHKAGTRSLFFTTGCLLWALTSCRHDHDNNNGLPNPCLAAKANPLTFQFLEYSDTPTPDTTYNNQFITFSGPGAPYTAYEWQVGSAAVRRTQKFALFFDGSTVGRLPVRLIARRPPNTACFPHDDGVDTLTQVLTLVPFVDPVIPLRNPKAPIYGKFQGATRTAPRDTFTVRIYQGTNYFYPTDPTAPPTDYVSNIPKGCRLSYFDNYLGWRGVLMGAGGCTTFHGNGGYLISRDSIRLTFRTQEQPKIVEEVFLGKRIR